MTKTLNLDKLASKETRELVLFGETYEVREMSVESFIETTRTAELLEKETSFAKQVETTIDLIKRSVPDVARENLMRMTIDQLRAVSAFIRGATPEEILLAEGAKTEGAEVVEGAAGEQKND